MYKNCSVTRKKIDCKGGGQMNIHEFQGKSLLSQFDIPVQPGIVLDLQSNLTSLKTLSEQAGKEPVFAVKAQIHAGGRGKGKY